MLKNILIGVFILYLLCGVVFCIFYFIDEKRYKERQKEEEEKNNQKN